MTRDNRRLAAIVSADVVGYSRLMGVDDSGTLAALKAHRRELIDPKIAEYGGRIVKTTGDGLLLEFASVVDAVRCAVDVQRGMAERNADVTPDKRLEFRIGVNVGDIIIDDDDIFGDGVNVAARLQALADPGGICASRVVRDQVMNKLSFEFEDLGAQHVKNIARPVDIYRVNLGGGTPHVQTLDVRRMRRWFRLRGAGGIVSTVILLGLAIFSTRSVWLHTTASPAFDPPPLSVVVLPFATVNKSGEGNVAETLRNDVITGLGTVARDIKAVRSDATPIGAADDRDFGRRLNVRYIVEADVRRDGPGNVVNLRLVDAVAGVQAWSEQYTVPDAATRAEYLTGMRKMVGALSRRLREVETRRIADHPIGTLTATGLALRGDLLMDRSPTLADVEEAGRLYEAALRKDPNLVYAMVQKIYALELEYDLDLSTNRASRLREMDDLSVRAVQLDDADSRVWRARSAALVANGRWEAALEAADHAIANDPQDPQKRVNKAVILGNMGRPQEALAIVNQALAMKPTYIGWAMTTACEQYLNLGQPDRAIAACEKAAPQEPNWTTQLLAAAAYANAGELEKAAAAKDRMLRQMPGITVAGLRAKNYSYLPEYLKLADTYLYPGLIKAGFPAQ